MILSGHSGADQPIAEMLDSGEGASGKAPGKLAGLFLFDSMIASAFSGSVWNYVDRRLKDELDHLRLMKFSPRPKDEVEAEMETWLRENGFRLQVVYRKGGAYDAAARDIEGKLALAFGAAGKVLGPRLLQMMREHYAVHEITDTARIQHMDVLSGDDAFQKALETLPGGEPRRPPRRPGPRSRSRSSRTSRRSTGRCWRGWPPTPATGRSAGCSPASRHRAPTAGAKTPETVKVKVRWDKTEPPQKYLKDAFTGHPVDWKAEVLVDGKSVGSGDGSLEIDLVKDSKHDIRVVPTPASKDLDYYEPRTVTLKKAAAGDFDVRLGYNRENQYFTDESWEAVGIDPVKAGKVKSVDLLGKKVLVNELVIPTVDATNKHFNDKTKVSDEERKEITDSLVSIGGYNRRTTSSGSFSNHSTGCAIDINENLETFQNMHFKAKEDGKKNTPHLQTMELVAKVVKRESGWSSWDPWAETELGQVAGGLGPLQPPLPEVPQRAARRRPRRRGEHGAGRVRRAARLARRHAGGRRADGRRAGPEEAAHGREGGDEGEEGRDRQVARARRGRLDPDPGVDRGRRDVQEGRLVLHLRARDASGRGQGEARGRGRAARPHLAAPEARGDARGRRLDLADRRHRGQGLHALRGPQGLRGDQEEEVKAPILARCAGLYAEYRLMGG